MKYRTKDGEEFEADSVEGIKELMALAAGKVRGVTGTKNVASIKISTKAPVEPKEKTFSVVPAANTGVSVLMKDQWDCS